MQLIASFGTTSVEIIFTTPLNEKGKSNFPKMVNESPLAVRNTTELRTGDSLWDLILE